LTHEAIRIEREEFTQVTLDLLGRSFGVDPPDDLDIIFTAEDLFEEVMYRQAGNAVANRCDTAMLFFRLRGQFERLDPKVRVTPSSALPKLVRLSPKRLAKRLGRETGLAMPDVLPGKLGCASLIVGFIGAPLAWWLVDVAAFAGVALVAALMMFADRGGFWAEWKDVWSLTDAIACKNVTRKDAVGLQGRAEDMWRRYAEILALSAMSEPNGARLVDANRIGRMTRIELV
jgi:hypothetical protein